MKPEIEAKFLQISPVQMRQKLLELDCICIQPRTLMRRLVFDNPHNPSGYLRVRDEWGKVTMTLKEVHSEQVIDGIKELEIQISSFEMAKAMLNKVGLIEKAYQETYRESREKNGVVFTLDERPGLKPFMEVEAEDEERLRQFVDKIWLTMDQAVYGTVTNVYQLELWLKPEYVNKLPRITFDNPPRLAL